jgi:hypothetical protein
MTAGYSLVVTSSSKSAGRVSRWAVRVAYADDQSATAVHSAKVLSAGPFPSLLKGYCPRSFFVALCDKLTYGGRYTRKEVIQ